MAKSPAVLVRYEDLHTDTQATLNEALSVLGTEVEPGVIERAIELFSFGNLSGRPAASEDTKAFFRKGSVGDWKSHFSARDVGFFCQEAGDVLKDMGYEVNK